MPSGIFFRPPGAWVGDVIPYYWHGEYWLYYLHETRAGVPGVGTAWHLVRTRDFVEFDYLGEVLPSGGRGADDLHCYTGSIFEHEGAHHLFYTAYNGEQLDPELGAPVQSVRHAVSHDLVHWTKLSDRVEAPRGVFDPRDWRDPFVYRSAPGAFAMLVATRTADGPERRRGVIARATSRDLITWEVTGTVIGGRFYMHECPDLFKVEDWWYLVFSEFSDGFTVRYRMAKTPDGPWQSAPEDSLDSRAYYAAKTAGDGTRRYAFGWIPTKDGEADGGAWQWGGELVVHELCPREDGRLDTRMPETVRESFSRAVCLADPVAVVGDWAFGDEAWRADAPDSYAEATLGPLPDDCRIVANLRFDQGTRECGLVVRGSPDGPAGYYVRLDPLRGRMVLDQWPRTTPGALQWEIGGDKPYVIESERAVELGTEPHHLEVLVSGTIAVVYLDRTVAMTFRMYDRAAGQLGLFVAEGSATFSGAAVFVR